MANTSSQDGKSKDQPQTLDELLERQWEQGSQFLMEQASHFDSKYIKYISAIDRVIPTYKICANEMKSKLMII